MKKKATITPLDKTLSKSEYYQEVIIKPAEKLLKALMEAEVHVKATPKVRNRYFLIILRNSSFEIPNASATP